MKKLLIAAAALSLLAGEAYAQSSANSGSNSSATNSSASRSSAVSSPRVNVIGNPIGNGASSSYSNSGASASTRSKSSSAAYGNTTTVNIGTSGSASDPSATDPSASGSSGGGDPTIHYDGGYTVRNTPEVIPPSVVGGNTCAIGVSGGLSLPGFGIAGGATWADRACERRQEAALLYNMGEHKVAYTLMCQDDNVRKAMREAGKPCLQDQHVADAAPVAAPPAPAVAAAPATPPAAATKVSAVEAPPRPKPAWCTPDTLSPEHLRTLSQGQQYYIHLNCGT